MRDSGSHRRMNHLRRKLAQQLVNSWHVRGAVNCLLLPVSAVYGALIKFRRRLYQAGLYASRRVDAVVLVVGNVVAGGAGKTPTVIEIALHLKQLGLQVGVITRGYGRTSNSTHLVMSDSLPDIVGDEPLLIHQATQCPVMVGASRFEVATALLALQPEIDVLLCDDGLQHYGLYRDIEVCVFDDRGIGNGWVLPAGPLREPWPRTLLRSCGQSARTSLMLNTGTKPAVAGFQARRSLGPFAVTRDGARIPVADVLRGTAKPFYAVAGIAQPHVFFAMLRALQIPLAGAQGLADHDDFTQFNPAIAQKYTLLCTEKDARKLWQLAPDALAMPLEQTAEPAFFETLDNLVGESLKAKLTLRHGHKIA